MITLADSLPEGYRWADGEDEVEAALDGLIDAVQVRKPEHGPEATDLAVADTPMTRLEVIRAAIRAECISYGEIAELQGLYEEGHIAQDDDELLAWAGLTEE